MHFFVYMFYEMITLFTPADVVCIEASLKPLFNLIDQSCDQTLGFP